MDLLAPCRSCLQCLPFFHVSPPSSPRPAVAVPSSSLDASKATPTDPSQSSENLPCLSAAHTVQEQDLCLPGKAEEEPQAAKSDKDETEAKLEDESTATESEAVPVSGIIIAPPVSSPGSGASLPEDPDDDKTTNIPELPLEVPFINDITFSASGFMPLQSPITPAPFGAGYPAGQYPLHTQIYPDAGHAHSHHGYESSQQDHEHSLHGYESSQHEYSNSHHGHHHLHHGHAHSHDTPDCEVLLTPPPLDDSPVGHELHKHASHHHSHHHSHDSSIVGDVDNSVAGHTSLDVDHHDKVDDISPNPPLEASQSTPDLDLEAKVAGENSAGSHSNGASALLETYHSEPVVLSGDSHDDDNEAQNEVLDFSGSHPVAPHRRRRDHFRDQFKGFKQQIKQGGHHMKEEGSKHMQNIIENLNKQAQQIEQSGSFFVVPRANNN